MIFILEAIYIHWALLKPFNNKPLFIIDLKGFITSSRIQKNVIVYKFSKFTHSSKNISPKSWENAIFRQGNYYRRQEMLVISLNNVAKAELDCSKLRNMLF